MRLVLALAMTVLPVAAAAQQGLAGSEWRPLTIAGQPFPEGVEAIVQFGADGRLTGRGGCNRFTGAYSVDGETLTVGPVAATRMACPEPAMSAEAALFAAFEAVATFSRDGADLNFLDADGVPVAAFAQTDWD
ncbi:META domain-containing protein [Amaricoccus sp.]|uniref:META domain-containing protein n=1 Tax=Amaricoccus sp. TaxID=1872485 RepID=UPI001B4C9907|nr:META domain-containing protein [Amaricoccus sp.]MBP7242379.1 META domain-containing protein [Amaricoccus sp.]